ncbi:MAG: ATP-dependent endonuclease, partial [Candidatus Hodarchaeota archaeon]
MKLKKLELENFKCFKKFTLTLGDFNVIIGINNSGKTSILQAVLFGHYLVRKCFWIDRERTAYANRTDYVFDLIPNMFVKDLWYNQKTRGKGNTSIPIIFSLFYEDDSNFQFEIHYRYGGLNHKVVKIPQNLSTENLKGLLEDVPLFIPASTGIIVKEEYRASGVRDFLISSGRSSELIRSFLYDISVSGNGSSKEIEFIRAKLKQIFGISDLKVEWNEATDAYLKTFYREKGNTFDLVSGGSGFIQFIQILSKIYYRKSTLVLLDEPDAHLNPNLVYDMIRTLQEYAKEISLQIVIATHSKDVLDVVEAEQISIIDANQSESKTCAEGKEAAYEALGISLPVRELAFLQMFSKVLLVEGSSDRNLLDQFGTIYNPDFKGSLRNVFILTIGGKDNFDAYVNFFNSLERRLSKNID